MNFAEQSKTALVCPSCAGRTHHEDVNAKPFPLRGSSHQGYLISIAFG